MSLMRSARASEAVSSRSDIVQSLMNILNGPALERRERRVEEPRQPTHAIRAVDDSLALVTYARIGEFVGSDGVVRGDVGRADHPGDVHELIALIEVQGLVALHDQIAV